MKGKLLLSQGLVVCVALATACSGLSPEARYEASAEARQYPITGVVRAADPKARQVTVAHEAIPGLMDGMTMSFSVKEAWASQVAQPGDRLSGTLVVDGTRSWIQGISLSKPAIADATGSIASATDAGIGPAAGTPLPSTPLRDQAGRTVTARTFAGRDVILTFIYTNCPLPDFCPLMMRRLDEAAARLRKAGRRDDVQMVAITIDPARDTPKVLEAYGRAHISGEDAADPFHRWSLLTGTPEQVRAWATFFALTYEPEGKEIAHGLRTAVVDREGKVVGVLRGNEWTTDELMRLLPSR